MSTNKNRGRRGRRRGGRKGEETTPLLDRPKPPCVVCGEPVKDITSALCFPPDGGAGHFDCALKQATEQLVPKEGEKVIYLGKGRFAAVDDEAYRKRRLAIVRELDWEQQQEEPVSWRVDLRTDVP